MNDYGLVSFTALGSVQFDSRKQMNSFVVDSSGTGSSAPISTDSLVFVKGKAGLTGLYVYGTASGGNYSFRTYNPSNQTTASVSLSYLVCTPAKDVTVAAGDDFGLIVKSPDGTVQFDSRAMIEDEHFNITDYWVRQDQPGNPDASGSDILTTDTAEYVELRRNSVVQIDPEFQQVSGIRFSGTNGEFAKFVSIERSGSFESGFSTVYNNNRASILIAELDV